MARLAQERVGQDILLLKGNLAEPPSLEKPGRNIGSSYSRLRLTFSARTRRTIMQYLRQRRMDKMAELLRSGGYHVTEAALAVGYNSLSDAGSAFHETFGCCPGPYPMVTVSQRLFCRKAGV